MKKKLTFVFGIIAIVLMFGLAMAACNKDPEEHDHDWSDWMPFIYPNDILGGWEKRYCKTDNEHTDIRRVSRQSDDTVVPENFTNEKRWTKEVDVPVTATLEFSVNSEDVCTVTVSNATSATRWKTNVHYYYTAKANSTYEYKFEAWTVSGERTLGIQCYYDFDTGDYLFASDDKTINSERKTYTARGGTIPKSGIRSLQFLCADKVGTFYVKVLSIKEYVLEELPIEERWIKSEYPGTTAFVDIEVDGDDEEPDYGLCTITVSGTAMSIGDVWRARANYLYTAKANTTYEYKFEAWTESGERNLNIQYYYDEPNNIYRDAGVRINGTRKTYSFKGNIEKGGVRELRFQVAGQTGKFFVKIISIEEASGSGGGDEGDWPIDGEDDTGPVGGGG